MNKDAHTTAVPWETGNDELERLALEETARRQRVDHSVSVLVMPAGRCQLATRFARLGAQVTVADSVERQPEVEGRILASGQRDAIRFLPCSLPTPPANAELRSYDIIVLRRGLCSQGYAASRQTIRQLMQHLKIGGKLFVSILGLHSELGEGYGGRDQSLYERFSMLSPTMANKYGIDGPVCLYSERDLFLLLLESGASVLRTMTSTWGNVKAVAVRV